MSSRVLEAPERPSLRALLRRDGIVVAPGAYDMLSALLIEQVGFECVYLTGNGQAASMLGVPDVGLITLSEMAERVRATRACVGIPLIADADIGYGSYISVQRTVREFEAAGAGGIQIEDQASPKRCGHELGRQVVPVEEMVARLRAAADARRPDTVLIARTDARTTLGLEEAIRRGNAYADAGADIVFVESPESEDEFRAIAAGVSAPVLANMVETGRSPYLGADQLERLGVKVAIYPATAFLAATGAVRRALRELRARGRVEDARADMLSLQDYHALLRFHDYAGAEQRYAPANSTTREAQAHG